MDNHSSLLDLIANLENAKENIRLEFKISKNSLPKSFWETYSSFANTQGGFIILGVDENSPNVVVGVDNAEKIKNEIFSVANNKSKVSCNLLEDSNVREHVINDKTIVSVYVPELEDKKKPLYLNDDLKFTYIRKSDGDYRASMDDLRRLIRNSHDNVDSELLDERKYTIEDLNLDSVLMFKNLLHQREPSKHFLEMSDFDFLKTVGVFRIDRDDERKIKLTLAGLLFLGKFEAITSKIPHFHLEYINKRGKNVVTRWSDRISTGGSANLNLFEFHRIVLEKLRLTVEEKFELDSMSVRRSETELNVALREALTNMIVHADYLDSENTTKIEVDDLYYVFFNAGRMKVSETQFFNGGQSVTRNPILFQFFRRLGYCERAGTGGKEIADVYQKIGKYRFPDLEIAPNHTSLKLWCAVPVETYPELSQHAQRVFKIMDKNGNFKKSDIIRATGLSEYYVREAIKELQSKNLVLTHGKGPATRYFCNLSRVEKMNVADKLRNLVMNS